MEIRNSKFLSDCSTNDIGKEAIMSFQMSWILRNTIDNDVKCNKPILYRKCREILFKLLNIPDKDIEIKDVKVWKEWTIFGQQRLDVIANILLEVSGSKEWHILLIENKVYTDLKESQIYDYPKYVKEEYENVPLYKGYTLHQCVVTCQEDDKLQEVIDKCKNTEWSVFGFDDLVDWENDQLTESELFNEFWYSRWDTLPE